MQANVFITIFDRPKIILTNGYKNFKCLLTTSVFNLALDCSTDQSLCLATNIYLEQNSKPAYPLLYEISWYI